MSLNTYKLNFQVAPIILTGGIASSMYGAQAVNMLALTNPSLASVTLSGTDLSIASSLLSQGSSAQSIGGLNYDLDDAFGAFTVIPGGSLVAQTVPKYPLADMTMAANAIVREPLILSLVWDTPMRGASAWSVKSATMQMLKSMLDAHNNLGGLYSVMTPAWTYTNLILVALTDASRGESPLPQNAWRFDFERPQVMTTAEATADQNTLMSRITNGLPTNGATSGNQTPTVVQPSESGGIGMA